MEGLPEPRLDALFEPLELRGKSDAAARSSSMNIGIAKTSTSHEERRGCRASRPWRREPARHLRASSRSTKGRARRRGGRRGRAERGRRGARTPSATTPANDTRARHRARRTRGSTRGRRWGRRGRRIEHSPMSPIVACRTPCAPQPDDRMTAFPLRRGRAAPRPALAAQDGATLARLVGVMRGCSRPDGCPWDREQTFETLRKYVLEEACEVIDAIDSRRSQGAARGAGRPAPPGRLPGRARAARGSVRDRRRRRRHRRKLVHRHPHVFGDLDAQGRRRGAQQLGEASRPPRRRDGASSAGCRGACRRSRARSASARRSRASASTGRRAGVARQGRRGDRRARPGDRARRRRTRSRRRWATCSSRSSTCRAT